MSAPVLQTPPEFADAGYWYVFESTPYDSMPGKTAPKEAGTDWTGFHGTVNSIDYIVIRKPDAETLPQSGMSAVEVLSNSGFSARPYGRIRGR